MGISRRKFVVFALLTLAMVFSVGLVAMLAMDLVLHHRAERSAGLNRWGYRGPVVASRQANEVRIVMLGGSTVFGYGVMWNESIPAMLEQRLNQQRPDKQWTVINLGYNTEGAFAFLPNLKDFASLDYDMVVLYEGYNDLLGDLSPNYVAVRQQSPVFRATGYFPILPLWLREKALMLNSGGDLAKGYEARLGEPGKAVFRPSLVARASASALNAARSVAGAFERQFEVAESRDSGAPSQAAGSGCPAPWSDYCDSQRRAIQFSLDQGKRVLVVSQPFMSSAVPRQRHQEQQQALAGMLARVFGTSPRVAHFAVGDRVDVSSTDVSFDSMHLNPDGNRIVAAALAEPTIQLWSKP